MYELSVIEKVMIDCAKEKKGRHFDCDDQIQRYVKKYEQNPEQIAGGNARIRYEANKRGFTLGELEIALSIKGGSISSSALSHMPKVDAALAYFFDTPISALRNVPRKPTVSRTAKILRITKLLRKLVDELETV